MNASHYSPKTLARMIVEQEAWKQNIRSTHQERGHMNELMQATDDMRTCFSYLDEKVGRDTANQLVNEARSLMTTEEIVMATTTVVRLTPPTEADTLLADAEHTLYNPATDTDMD